MKKILLIFLSLTLCLTTLRAQDADSLKFRVVSLGVLAQGNYAGEDMFIAESGLTAYPGFGFELGGFIDYHITKRLLIEVQVILGLQNGSYVATDKDLGFLLWHKRPISYLADMRLIGMDIPLFLTYTLPCWSGNFRLGAGVFTHITFDAWSPGDRDFITPYHRIIEEAKTKNGKPRYALSDSHAGLGFQVGYEFPSGLMINLSGKYSVIDIINYESEKSYAHPYKVSLGFGWHF